MSIWEYFDVFFEKHQGLYNLFGVDPMAQVSNLNYIYIYIYLQQTFVIHFAII